MYAAKTHGAEATLRGGERKNGKGANAGSAKPQEKFTEPRFGFRIRNDKWLLRFPNPTGRIAFDRIFRADRFVAVQARFEHVETHGVFLWIVQNERQEIGFHNGA